MSVTVETTYQGRDDFPTFPTADDYTIDPAGNLILSTGRCQPVAVFAAGRWMCAKVTPNRDEHGRFAKRGR
jgi:hypothetical protein